MALPLLRVVVVLLVTLLMAPPAHAGGAIGVWGETFPQASDTAKPVPAASTIKTAPSPVRESAGWRTCVAEILAAEIRHEIPDNYLLAIALTESGRRTELGSVAPWPWTVNAEGEGRYFQTRRAALEWVREGQRAGKRSIDIGCMQINLRWHPQAFESLEEGFNPRANVDYAARLLKSLREAHGSWREAVGRYHSHTTHLKTAYRERVFANHKYIGAVKEALAEGGAQLAENQLPRKDAIAEELVAFLGTEEAGNLSWASWGLLAREEGVRALYAGVEFKPLIPHYSEY